MITSLEGGELGGSGGTHSDLSVTDWLVTHGELSEVVTNHVRSDLIDVPVLATVAFHLSANHVRNDDGVSEMGSDSSWLFSVRALLN